MRIAFKTGLLGIDPILVWTILIDMFRTASPSECKKPDSMFAAWSDSFMQCPSCKKEKLLHNLGNAPLIFLR